MQQKNETNSVEEVADTDSSYEIHGDGVVRVIPEQLLNSERFRKNWNAARGATLVSIKKSKPE